MIPSNPTNNSNPRFGAVKWSTATGENVVNKLVRKFADSKQDAKVMKADLTDCFQRLEHDKREMNVSVLTAGKNSTFTNENEFEVTATRPNGGIFGHRTFYYNNIDRGYPVSNMIEDTTDECDRLLKLKEQPPAKK